MSFWRPGEPQPPAASPAAAASSAAKASGGSGSKPAAKAQLSQSVLSMKFMKRKEAEAAAAREVQRRTDETQWRLKRRAVQSEEQVRSSVAVEEKDPMALYPGRRSFGGYNSFIEQTYKRTLNRNKLQQSTLIEEKNTVSDKEMMERFEKYVGQRAQQQQAKRKRKQRS